VDTANSASIALDATVSVWGDVVFICDDQLLYYSTKYGYDGMHGIWQTRWLTFLCKASCLLPPRDDTALGLQDLVQTGHGSSAGHTMQV
jgi:hypothetical protein